MQSSISYAEIASFVENNISLFHDKQLEDLRAIKLTEVLQRKNPYLFRAKALNSGGEIVKYVLDAFLISREETNFGDFLERLAIFINSRVYGGWKSGNTGIDLEFDKDGVRYIVSIKSGPNWGNSDQKNKMYLNFEQLMEALAQENPGIQVVPVNGCCYGKSPVEQVGYIKSNKVKVREVKYQKLCGQRFWSFISGNSNLYTEIVEPLGHQAKQKNDAFIEEYGALLNRFTTEFNLTFCDASWHVKWDELVKLSSAAIDKLPKVSKASKFQS